MEHSTEEFSETISTPAEAFGGVAFAAIASDREIKDIEHFYMQALFSRMRVFEGWTVADYMALFKNLRVGLEQYGVMGLLEMSMAALPTELYQAAFAVSVDLIFADGIIRDEEEEFLYRLQQSCHIDSALASQILRVVAIKNQC